MKNTIKFTSDIVDDFVYQLRKRKDYILDQKDNIESYWEQYGGVPSDNVDYHSIRLINEEFDKIQKLIKVVNKI